MKPPAPKVDWVSFCTCVSLIFVVSLPLVAFPEQGGKVLVQCYNFIAQELGFLYLFAGTACIVFLSWLALSRFGQVVLGNDESSPEFSSYSWAGMLFCAGVGAGLLFWAPVEWAYYYDSPPFQLKPRSVEAAHWASTYGLFHWGPTAWCFYCLPTIAIAYPYYVHKVPFLRFSTSCHYLMKGDSESSWGRAIDIFFMVALLGGAGSSLGFSTPLIASCISHLTGTENGFGLEIFVVVICVAMFATSVWFGLKKGIRRLSDINLALAFAVLAFVLAVGPTAFLLKTSLSSLGNLAQNFIRLNTYTDAFTDSKFVEDWTIFYWAWWIAYAPFVGLFVTRISRGRTIRQVIFGMVGFGTLGGLLFYMILGNYGLHLELTETLSVTSVLKDHDQATAVVATLDALPWSSPLIAVFALVCIVFAATTYDSASYILASSASQHLPAGSDPPRWHRVFWAVTLAVLPITLMFVGGLKVLQTAVLVVSLPILFVGVLMSVCLVKQLRKDYPS